MHKLKAGGKLQVKAERKILALPILMEKQTHWQPTILAALTSMVI